MKFTLTLYTKCKGQACPVLGGLDDTTKVLEDNMLSLQSISGSRNAAPFINTVRQWEKDLSTISDILEVSGRVSSLLPLLLKVKESLTHLFPLL